MIDLDKQLDIFNQIDNLEKAVVKLLDDIKGYFNFETQKGEIDKTLELCQSITKELEGLKFIVMHG